MYSNGIKIACFFQIRLSNTSLLNTSPNLDIFTFNFGKPDNSFWSFVLQYLCPAKSSSLKNF